jgi:ATP-dependent protease HslVU (ClpYQ) peptidase subunit
MTTIAATREALAGDRMVFDDGRGAWYPAMKVKRFKDMVVGAAGDSSDCMRFLDWAEENFNPKKKPRFERGDTDEAATILVLKADGIYIMSCSDPYPEFVAADHYAIGSGGKAAMAALYSGKTLAEAMDIAHAIDPYTRPPFDILPIDEKKK